MKFDFKEDRLAEAFYHARDYDEAIQKLKFVINEEDWLEFVEAVEYLKPRIYSQINQSNQFKKFTTKINDVLSHKIVVNYLKKAEGFYQSTASAEKLNIYLVCRPDSENDSAFILNNTIIMLIPNSAEKFVSPQKLIEYTSILMHEMMHFYSMSAKGIDSGSLDEISNNPNEPITKSFIIEEPLAVILGQKLFKKICFPEFYDFYESEYTHPWVDTLSRLNERLVEDYLEQNKPMDRNLLEKYSLLANKMIEAGADFER